MKEQHDKGPAGTFADKMRERLLRGTGTARQMIDRVRELLAHHEAEPASAAPVADAPAAASSHAAATATTAAPTTATTAAAPAPVASRSSAPPAPPAPPAPAPAATPDDTRGLAGVRTVVEQMTQRARKVRPSKAAAAEAAATAPSPGGPEPEATDATEAEPDVDIAPEFATATMGTILLSQGRAAEAQAVFQRVLARDPGDAEAQRGLVAATGATGASAEPATTASVEPAAHEPREMLDRAPPPASYNASEARALPVDPTTLVVFWELTRERLAHAGAHAPPSAALALQVVSFEQGPQGEVRSERWIEQVPTTGDYFVSNLASGAEHEVTVGLRYGGTFVPLVASGRVATPRGRPSAESAAVRATLALPPRTEGAPNARPEIVSVTGPQAAVEQLVASHPGEAVAVAERTFAEGAPQTGAFDAGQRAWGEHGPGGAPSSADLAGSLPSSHSSPKP